MAGGGFRVRTWGRRALCAIVAAAAEACSVGSGTESLVPGPDPPANEAQAARFLTRSTFGPSSDELHRLSVIGYTAWFDEQARHAPSLQRPTLEVLKAQGASVSQDDRMRLWWKHAVRGPDQLRQRLAFALSEIFVVSDVAGAIQDDPVGTAEYYDLLARDALGNFRTLLEDVTKSPAMGRYLSMLKNRKADPAHNTRPDENYAREVMQLFTIGLVRLNADGTEMQDGLGQPIPTYDQTVVEGFAATFTGWNYADATSWNWPQPNFLPMEPWEEYHETAAKTVLDGVVLPAGLSAQEDLTAALDLLFEHPNAGPFFARGLIQRLVTSNPSPAYVGRVAAVFADDGSGVRGNLLAVAKAVLLDDEAVHGHETNPQTFGKLREPLLRLTVLWRALDALTPTGRFESVHPESDFGQASLRSPSVFNFFPPDYRPPGALLDAGLRGPEFLITTETLITSSTNQLYDATFRGWYGRQDPDDDLALIQLAPLLPLAADPPALVEETNRLFLCGAMSSEMRSIVESMVTDTDPMDPRQRALEALYLVATSPEFAVQK